jgi:hypothetical protein
MQRFPPAYLIWISLLAFAATSCHTPRVVLTGAEKKPEQLIALPADGERAEYRVAMVYGGQELPGRLIIRNDSGNVYRLAFFNELGMTYLEGTYRVDGHRGRLETHKLAPFLDHRAVIRAWERSLSQEFD